MSHKEFAAAVIDGIAKDGRFAVHGLGTFTVVDTEARIGRNPQTGEPIDIPAGKRIKFKASVALKAAINGGNHA